MKMRTIAKELRIHAPSTAFGTVTGIVIMAFVIRFGLPRETSSILFRTFHPLHVVLSALVTAGMYPLHSAGTPWRTLLIGHVGAIGIATLSDRIIPYVGELLPDLPNRDIHLGVIEKRWPVNPLALAGVGLAYVRPRTKFPHAAHLLLSTRASLFHITMAVGTEIGVSTAILLAVFSFLAVWVPCCTSDIVFPLLFAKDG